MPFSGASGEGRVLSLPDGRSFEVDAEVLVDPGAEGRLLLWIPTERRDGYQFWERLSTASQAKFTVHGRLHAVRATSSQFRQTVRRSIPQWLGSMMAKRSDRTVHLPTGELVEHIGGRRSDWTVVWAAEGEVDADDSEIRTLISEAGSLRSIGRGVYVVDRRLAEGADQTAKASEQEPRTDASPGEESPMAVAEHALSAARRAGDGAREATALTDLGVLALKRGDSTQAAELLREACRIATSLGNRDLEADASINLALALFNLGRPMQAIERLSPALTYAQSVSDPYTQKRILEQRAIAFMSIGKRDQGLADFEQARVLAGAVGDLDHEASLLWRMALVHAEQGNRDQAMQCAETAVDLWRRRADPATEWYQKHLDEYRAGRLDVVGQNQGAHLSGFGGAVDTSTARATAAPAGSGPQGGPGALRMAITAAKAMKTFVGSGFKTVVGDAYRSRLAACSACEHHTGVRCRLCGCITMAKARLHHEHCPVGRW